MTRILVIEDDWRISNLVRLYLHSEGFEVIQAFDGREGVRLAGEVQPDLIVLDLMLPGLHGRDACLAIRQRSSVPILMLTALDDDRDIVEGLDVGADDYITKPFQPNVLVARVRAALRRADGHAAVVREVIVGNLALAPDERRVTLAGEAIELRTKEYDLLLALASSPFVVLTREYLLETVWGGEYNSDTRTIDVHINRLRAKITHSDVEIETVRSVGYRLVPPTGSSIRRGTPLVCCLKQARRCE
jgi:DNA-binding response OmpR family regulator